MAFAVLPRLKIHSVLEEESFFVDASTQGYKFDFLSYSPIHLATRLQKDTSGANASPNKAR